MENFEEVKKIIIDIAKKGSACESEFIKAVDSKNISELLTVMLSNSNWCFKNGIFSDIVLSKIPLEILNEKGIYYNQKDLSFDSGNQYLFGSSSSKHYGSSSSKHYGSSSSEHYDSSSSKHYDSSSSEHYDSSSSEHYDLSSSEHYDLSSSKHYGSSSSKHYDSSSSEHYDLSSSKHYGSSSSKHYDSSYASVYELNEKINDSVVIRERSTGIIHVNTNLKIKKHK